jgi:hypothetical protein
MTVPERTRSQAQLVLDGLARLRVDGPGAVERMLDPDVEMLGPEPSPWDCHGRDAVIRFLREFEPGGTDLAITESTDIDDKVLLGTLRTYQNGETRQSYSVVSFRNGRVARMRGYPRRDRALQAIHEP